MSLVKSRLLPAIGLLPVVALGALAFYGEPPARKDSAFADEPTGFAEKDKAKSDGREPFEKRKKAFEKKEGQAKGKVFAKGPFEKFKQRRRLFRAELMEMGDPAEMSVDQLIEALKEIRVKRVELDVRDKVLRETLLQKLDAQRRELEDLGIGRTPPHFGKGK